MTDSSKNSSFYVSNNEINKSTINRVRCHTSQPQNKDTKLSKCSRKASWDGSRNAGHRANKASVRTPLMLNVIWVSVAFPPILSYLHFTRKWSQHRSSRHK